MRPPAFPITNGEANDMTTVCYEVVQHDGGWAYRVDGTYSETFRSHDLALRAAKIAAAEQERVGDTTTISYEDKDGVWHEELARGDDRPDTGVIDRGAR
jgi:hypothetical protein